MTNEEKPEKSRDRILKSAFKEMHQHGYQGMRIDQVLKNTGLKKGALYHHFPSKQVLAYAVLEELIQKRITELWIEPLKNMTNPIEGIYTLCLSVGAVWQDDFFYKGCPLNNLAQEMSPIDEGFRERILQFFQHWALSFSNALKKGQNQGFVDKNINVENSALFILSLIEGAFGMAKTHQNKAVYLSCIEELKRYLQSLVAINEA